MILSDYIRPTERQKEALKYIGQGHKVFYGGRRGGGKMSPLHTVVMTPFGERKIGDLEIGDTILNPNGSPQKVIQIFPHYDKDIYRLFFEDGASLEVGLDHLWLIRKTSSGKTKVKDNDYLNDDDFGRGVIMDTKGIIDWLDKKKNASEESTIKKQHICIPLCKPLQFTKAYKYNPRTIEPYVLGVLIGDGSLGNTNTNSAYFTNIDTELIDRLKSYGYGVTTYNRDTQHRLYGKEIGNNLAKLKLSGLKSIDKFIPDCYKYSSIDDRILLIQGLMDTDGYVDDRGHMSFSTISERLAKDFQWIIRSLGGKANITKNKAGYKDKDGEYIQCNDCYDVYFNTKMNSQLVYLSRKKDRTKIGFNNNVSELQRRIIGYEYVGKMDARCITVSHPNSLYVADDFVVTHNSHIALAAAVIGAKRFPGLKTVVVRETYQELVDNFIQNVLELYPEKIFKYRYIKQDKTAHFENGSKIKFRACDSIAAARKIQGIEYQFMVIDEAPNLTPYIIMLLTGSLRNSRIKGWIPSLFMTGNPGGLSDMYFKTRYVKPDYKLWSKTELANKDQYIFIPAGISDNPYVGPEYDIMINSIADDNLRKAWLGDWDSFSGQFFIWNPDRHICQPFDIPKHWLRIAAIDEGFTDHPTVCLFGAQDPDTGRLYIYKEYAMKGSIEEHIQNIKGLIEPDEIISFWVADTSLFTQGQKRSADMSSALMYMEQGISLFPANKDRINGWRIVKQWLHFTEHHEPMLQFFPQCIESITTIPSLRYNIQKMSQRIEDCDSKMKDDAADALRYMVTTFLGPPTFRATDESEVQNRMYKVDDSFNKRENEDRFSVIERENFQFMDDYERDCYVSSRSYYL